MWGAGNVSLDERGTYTMTFSLDFQDGYNWDDRKEVGIYGVTVTDEFMSESCLQGLARELDLSGAISRALTWTRGSTSSWMVT